MACQASLHRQIRVISGLQAASAALRADFFRDCDITEVARLEWVSVERQDHRLHRGVPIMKLSARNQIPARVTSINSGEAIANVELDAGGVRLVASVTVEAVRELGLAEGSQVTAVIKASDVIVATN